MAEEGEATVRCNFCDDPQSLKEIDDHERTCFYHTIVCHICNTLYLLGDAENHKMMCSETSEDEEEEEETENFGDTQDERKFHDGEGIICDYCDSEILPSEIENHKMSCSSRIVECPECHNIFLNGNSDIHRQLCHGTKEKVRVDHNGKSSSSVKKQEKQIETKTCKTELLDDISSEINKADLTEETSVKIKLLSDTEVWDFKTKTESISCTSTLPISSATTVGKKVSLDPEDSMSDDNNEDNETIESFIQLASIQLSRRKAYNVK